MNRILADSYFALPTWTQDLAVSAYGLKLQYLRRGAEHGRVLERLRVSQWLSNDELEALQLQMLNATLRNARDSVPFYADRLPDAPLQALGELEGVPPLSKKVVQEAGSAILSNAYRKRALQIVHTGGTTGSPLSVYCNRAVLQRNYAFFDRFREWAGVQHGARVATFAGRALVPPDRFRPPYWRHNLAANTLLFSSYHIGQTTLGAYADALARFRPTLIDSYPSSLEPIARYVRERGVEIRPRAIITSSETLSSETRLLLEDAFHCPVFDHYGAAEMAAFVTQCPAGSYHVNSEFGIVEILRDGRPAAPGEEGEITATGFINPVMPLIRYATGDSAVQAKTRCSCGRAFPVLERILGRIDDVLTTPEGRRVGRLDPIFKVVAGLVETRLVQDRADHIRVETVSDQPLDPAAVETLTRELRMRLGPSMRIDVTRVSRIERTKGGKLRAVVNLVGHAEKGTEPDPGELAGPHGEPRPGVRA